MSDKYDYIIYHKNCFDGFTGFFLFLKTKKWTKNPYVYPDNPFASQAPPDIENKNIIVIDVAYKAEIINEIANKANKLLFIDHHVSIKEDVNNLNLQPPHEVVYDVNECGASLVWNYFFKNKKMPEFLKHIKDNDLGRWKLPNTIPFITSLEVHYKTKPTFDNLQNWDDLLEEGTLLDLYEKGQKYEIYKNYVINKKKYNLVYFPSKWYLKKYPDSQFKRKQFKLALINTDGPAISLLGKKISEECNCDGTILYRVNYYPLEVHCSIRSKETDVGSIAKELGGGGHKLASGFSWKLTKGSFWSIFERIEKK